MSILRVYLVYCRLFPINNCTSNMDNIKTIEKVKKLDSEEREFYMVASTLLKFTDSVTNKQSQVDDELTQSLRKQLQKRLK